jgi:hypothetical protein
MKTFTSVLLVGLVLIGTLQRSQSTTLGSNVVEKCKNLDDGDPTFSKGFCAGFVSGVMDGIVYMEVRRVKSISEVRLPYCLPEQVNNGQIIAVFVKYLKANPEQWHEPAAVLLVDSLSGAFPCHK